MTRRLDKFGRLYIKHKLWLNCVILALLFFVNCFWGNMIYFVYPLLCLLVIFDNQRNGFTYLVFSIPYVMLSLYVGTILYFVCVVIYVLKFYWILYIREKSKPNIKLLLSMAAFLVYCVLPIGPYDMNMLLKFCMMLFIFAVLGMVIKKPNIIRFNLNIRILCYSLLLSSAFTLMYPISPYLQSVTPIFFANSATRRFQALLTQPNVLAMVCEIVVSIFVYFIISKRACWKDYVLCFVITGLGLTTFSKTYLILIMVIYAMLFIWMLVRNFARTVVISSVVVSILALISCYNLNFFMVFYNRFMGSFANCKTVVDFINMVTSNRYDLWVEYLAYLAHNPVALVFGEGLGASALTTLSAHNAFISMVYQIGLVGVAILALAIVMIVIEYLKNCQKKPHAAICVPLLVILLILCVEDGIFYIYL